MSKKLKFPVKLSPEFTDNGFQTWVKRVYLYGNEGLDKLDDWSVGFYHCTHCGAWQSWSYKIPGEPKMFCPRHPEDKTGRAGFACTIPAHKDSKYERYEEELGPVSLKANHEWIDFLHAHSHGDGRAILFERKIASPAAPTKAES
jgi:hypothetical protein